MDLLAYLPVVITLLVSVLVLTSLYWLLLRRSPDLGSERKFSRQLLLMLLTLVGIIVVIMVLPISEESRNQLLGLVGLLVSAMIALSSTTIVSNLMAGLLLRMNKPFRLGDFVQVEQHFGRVSDRGLFDTEIQTEAREFITLPNAYLLTHPIITTRGSGAVVSTTLSLGYDVHHATIEPLLLAAAENSGLSEPFVHVLELGDYSVTYRVSGFLTEVKRLLAARSHLRCHVLDSLHQHGVEIVSPAFMNQRPLPAEQKVIPKRVVTLNPKSSDQESAGESMVFDKAERAEQLEREKGIALARIAECEEALKQADSDDKKVRYKQQLEAAQVDLQLLESSAKELKEKDMVIDQITVTLAPEKTSQ